MTDNNKDNTLSPRLLPKPEPMPKEPQGELKKETKMFPG